MGFGELLGLLALAGDDLSSDRSFSELAGLSRSAPTAVETGATTVERNGPEQHPAEQAQNQREQAATSWVGAYDQAWTTSPP